jgi:hypothetical protein
MKIILTRDTTKQTISIDEINNASLKNNEDIFIYVDK